MAEPFLAEIRIMSFGFPPRGWALCNGQFLPINQNQALFALLGTTFGGDGRVNFALPDLRGRAPIHAGSGHVLGERAGEETHTLSMAELPQHTHALNASASLDPGQRTATPGGHLLAQGGPALYKPLQSAVTMSPSSVTPAGGSQAHENMQPFLTLNFCIALQGIFPSPN